MSFALFACFFLMLPGAAAAQQSGPPAHLPWRNTFVVATESVLDQAASLDLNSNAAAFDSGFATLQTAEQNLEALAADEQEQDVVGQLRSMTFRLSSCRIQAVDGTDISACLGKLSQQRIAVMSTIHRHKDNGAWVDGDPRL